MLFRLTLIERLRLSLDPSSVTPEMQIAQFRAIAQEAWLFYGTFWLNLGALTYSFLDVAPLWLVLPPICLATPICILRSIYYTRKGQRSVSAEQAGRRLRVMNGTVRSTMIVTACWTIALAQYGGESHHLHILCFIILQTLSAVFGLMHIPATALQAAIPFGAAGVYLILFEASGTGLFAAVFLVMTFTCSLLSAVYHDIFASRVLQHHQLLLLGDENLRLANTDLVTGLPNRRNFLQRLEAELAAPEAPVDRIHLALVDLDGFKPVNDTYGHAVGDIVLKEVGRRMREFEERCDVARLGGDEFGILFHGDRQTARALAEEIGRSLRRPYLIAQGSVNVGATLGIASAADAKGEATGLLEKADYALYFGKAAGRNQVIAFDLGHEAAIWQRSRLEQTLRDADLERELSVQFQPIVDSLSLRPVMFEALARWHSPVLGQVPPQDFVTVAESCELISQLTTVLLVKALAAASTWPDEVGLSFNLSAQDLINPETTTVIAEALRESGVAPGRVTFELTETALVRDFAKAQANLQALKDLGAHLAIDDFGTGFSSLAYVHRLPIDKLKIDRSFVSELETSGACRDIVTSIIGLCRNRRLDCVAEGVETEGQAHLLRSLGCDLLQGYALGRPMQEEAVARFIAEAHREDPAAPGPREIAAFALAV